MKKAKRRTISTRAAKRLPVMTDVWIVKDETDESIAGWIMKVGRKKMIKSPMNTNVLYEITDREGWHYEVEV